MTIDNPIEMLTHEHSYILKVVHGLSVIDEELSRNVTVDVGRILRVVQFMRNFADKCHHAKEEAVLFPAMEAKGVPPTGCPLGAFKAEHQKGRKLVTALQEAADAYAAGQPEAVGAIRETVAEIRQLYPNHIWKEDEMAFPMALRLFTADELKQLKADFDQAESEFGQDHDQYVAFADEMERLLGE
ncbi:hemerythrin domain-containing protein [candidate division KSB1 bacterium]|nr:hemerythrin domain-containing protein [candidate division KSB1 bacterium]